MYATYIALGNMYLISIVAWLLYNYGMSVRSNICIYFLYVLNLKRNFFLEGGGGWRVEKVNNYFWEGYHNPAKTNHLFILVQRLPYSRTPLLLFSQF